MTLKSPNENAPEHWADLSEEQRAALLEMAKSRMFWKQFMARAEWLKGLATVVLTIIAAWTLLGDTVAEWLSGRK